MDDVKNGTNYSYEEYDWLYNNSHRYSVKELVELTGRYPRSVREHVARFKFRNVTPVPQDVITACREYPDLGDALIFLLPDIPLPVIQEALNAV